MENQNIKAIETLSNAMQAMVDKKMDGVARDRTRSGMIKTVNPDGTYKILIDGKEYDKVPAYGVSDLQVNDIVKVVYPENNPTNMFILLPSGAGSSALDAYPVGAVYISVVSTSPATLFGGTWEAWGAGRIPMGVGSMLTNTDTTEGSVSAGDINKTNADVRGGEKVHTLAIAEITAHAHWNDPVSTITSGRTAQHTHAVPSKRTWAGSNIPMNWTTTGNLAHAPTQYGVNQTIQTGGETEEHQHYLDLAGFASANNGGGGAHNNIQPYITCYMWKRTA